MPPHPHSLTPRSNLLSRDNGTSDTSIPIAIVIVLFFIFVFCLLVCISHRRRNHAANIPTSFEPTYRSPKLSPNERQQELEIMSAVYQSRVDGPSSGAPEIEDSNGTTRTRMGMGTSRVQSQPTEVAVLPAVHLGGRERSRAGDEVASTRPAAPIEEELPPPTYTRTPEPGHTVVA